MIYFLAGLPRSGSTVLAAILNQNPKLHVTATSGLISIMGAVAQQWDTDTTIHTQGRDDTEFHRMLKGLIDAKYATMDKPIVIDKNRGWPTPVIMRTMEKVLGKKPKIIATVRNVPDCVASFVRVSKPENVQQFLQSTHLIDVVKAGYQTLLAGMQENPECFCLIEYEDLLQNPQGEINKIHKFLGLEPFEYDFNRIEGSVVAEKDDEVWGIKGLHDIKPKLEKQHNQSAKDVLGWRYSQYNQPMFWRGDTTNVKVMQPIDLQLEAGKRGDFQKAREIGELLAKEEPDNDRAAYNRGLYALMDGKLQEGMELLSRGRNEKVFGDSKPNVPTQIWRGDANQTVLLYLEGGLGDQIHQTRFIQDIANRGCKVIVACSPELVLLISQIPNVTSVLVHESVPGVFHNAWVPGMSAPIPLGIEYKDVWGHAHLPKPETPKNEKFRIGLRWQGNPRFEHDHHKYFDPLLMFNAVKGFDVEYISLQRDEGAQHRPEWVKEVPLNSWEDTQQAAASCDLVISSCTSVAHLAAAMGVPTWVVVPVLPYYLWAIPGDKAPWYDSICLFRQEEFGFWGKPFGNINTELNKLFKEHKNAESRSMG
jgi:hypothetical protein